MTLSQKREPNSKLNGAYPTQNYTKTYNIYSECWQLLFGIKYFFN